MPTPKLTPEQKAAKNRERQRKWRERAFKDLDGHRLNRVNLALDEYSYQALRKLSDGYGLTHRELIERLLSEARYAVTASLDHEVWIRFSDGQTEPGALGAFDLKVRREPAPADTTAADMALQDNGQTREALRHNAEPATETEPSKPPLDLEPTTPAQAEREARVLELHQGGMAKRAIARELGLSESGVRGILKRLVP